MSDQKPIKPVAMLCRTCGSLNVMRDAWAVWDVKKQEWILGNIFDEAFCESCEHPTKIDEVPLETFNGSVTND